MNDAMSVGIIQRARHLTGQTHGIGHGELLFTIQPVTQRFPFDVRHDVVHRTADLTRVVQRENVGVLQVGGGFDLLQEARATDDRGQLRPQHLERHLAIVLDVVGQVHRGHAALAEL